MPTEIGDISSSAFQERLHNGDRSARELVTEEVWEIMDNNGKVPWNSISNFHEEKYAFLCNF